MEEWLLNNVDKYRLVLSGNPSERTFAITPNEDYAFYGITSPTTSIYQLNANDGTFVRAISLSVSFDVQRTNIKITSDSTKLVLNIDQGANSGIWYNLIGTNSFYWIFYLLKSGWTALTVISNSVVFAYRDSTFGNMILQKLTISSGFSTDWVMSALNTTSSAIGCSSSVYDPTYSTLYFSMVFDLTYINLFQ